LYTPQYQLIHYRWRNDDGSETSSSWTANEDTALSGLAKSNLRRLRFEIKNSGWTRGSGPQFVLEQAQAVNCATGTFFAVPTTSASAWQIVNSLNLTDNATTTATGTTATNAFFTPGYVKDQSNTTTALAVTSEQYTDIEYSIQATANATDGANYCFRLSNAGATSTFLYTVYPQVTLYNPPTLNVTIDTTTVSFPSLLPGSPVSTTNNLTVTTNNSSGFNVSANRSDAVNTLSLNADNTVHILDKTDWVQPGSTSTIGNANVYSGTGLAFRVRKTGTDAPDYLSAWWGADDTSLNALYAGIPSASSQEIVYRGSSAISGTNMLVEYKLDVPSNQRGGPYSGTIVYTIVVNP
jgi:hypothetical protein